VFWADLTESKYYFVISCTTIIYKRHMQQSGFVKEVAGINVYMQSSIYGVGE
jgi:hypothetical protein